MASQVRKIVLNYLSKWLDLSAPDSYQISAFDWRNCALKPDALSEALGLPLNVHGRIGRVAVSIPFNVFQSRVPIEIIIRDAWFLITLLPPGLWDPQNVKQSEIARRISVLQGINDQLLPDLNARKAAPSGQSDAADLSFLLNNADQSPGASTGVSNAIVARLTSLIVGKLRLDIRNVHIRFESRPAALMNHQFSKDFRDEVIPMSIRPFSLGLTIPTITYTAQQTKHGMQLLEVHAAVYFRDSEHVMFSENKACNISPFDSVWSYYDSGGSLLRDQGREDVTSEVRWFKSSDPAAAASVSHRLTRSGTFNQSSTTALFGSTQAPNKSEEEAKERIRRSTIFIVPPSKYRLSITQNTQSNHQVNVELNIAQVNLQIPRGLMAKSSLYISYWKDYDYFARQPGSLLPLMRAACRCPTQRPYKGSHGSNVKAWWWYVVRCVRYNREARNIKRHIWTSEYARHLMKSRREYIRLLEILRYTHPHQSVLSSVNEHLRSMIASVEADLSVPLELLVLWKYQALTKNTYTSEKVIYSLLKNLPQLRDTSSLLEALDRVFVHKEVPQSIAQPDLPAVQADPRWITSKLDEEYATTPAEEFNLSKISRWAVQAVTNTVDRVKNKIHEKFKSPAPSEPAPVMDELNEDQITIPNSSPLQEEDDLHSYIANDTLAVMINSKFKFYFALSVSQLTLHIGVEKREKFDKRFPGWSHEPKEIPGAAPTRCLAIRINELALELGSADLEGLDSLALAGITVGSLSALGYSTSGAENTLLRVCKPSAAENTDTCAVVAGYAACTGFSGTVDTVELDINGTFLHTIAKLKLIYEESYLTWNEHLRSTVYPVDDFPLPMFDVLPKLGGGLLESSQITTRRLYRWCQSLNEAYAIPLSIFHEHMDRSDHPQTAPPEVPLEDDFSRAKHCLTLKRMRTRLIANGLSGDGTLIQLPGLNSTAAYDMDELLDSESYSQDPIGLTPDSTSESGQEELSGVIMLIELGELRVSSVTRELCDLDVEASLDDVTASLFSPRPDESVSSAVFMELKGLTCEYAHSPKGYLGADPSVLINSNLSLDLGAVRFNLDVMRKDDLSPLRFAGELQLQWELIKMKAKLPGLLFALVNVDEHVNLSDLDRIPESVAQALMTVLNTNRDNASGQIEVSELLALNGLTSAWSPAHCLWRGFAMVDSLWCFISVWQFNHEVVLTLSHSTISYIPAFAAVISSVRGGDSGVIVQLKNHPPLVIGALGDRAMELTSAIKKRVFFSQRRSNTVDELHRIADSKEADRRGVEDSLLRDVLAPVSGWQVSFNIGLILVKLQIDDNTVAMRLGKMGALAYAGPHGVYSMKTGACGVADLLLGDMQVVFNGVELLKRLPAPQSRRAANYYSDIEALCILSATQDQHAGHTFSIVHIDLGQRLVDLSVYPFSISLSPSHLDDLLNALLECATKVQQIGMQSSNAEFTCETQWSPWSAIQETMGDHEDSSDVSDTQMSSTTEANESPTAPESFQVQRSNQLAAALRFRISIPFLQLKALQAVTDATILQVNLAGIQVAVCNMQSLALKIVNTQVIGASGWLLMHGSHKGDQDYWTAESPSSLPIKRLAETSKTLHGHVGFAAPVHLRHTEPKHLLKWISTESPTSDQFIHLSYITGNEPEGPPLHGFHLCLASWVFNYRHQEVMLVFDWLTDLRRTLSSVSPSTPRTSANATTTPSQVPKGSPALVLLSIHIELPTVTLASPSEPVSSMPLSWHLGKTDIETSDRDFNDMSYTMTYVSGHIVSQEPIKATGVVNVINQRRFQAQLSAEVPLLKINSSLLETWYLNSRALVNGVKRELPYSPKLVQLYQPVEATSNPENEDLMQVMLPECRVPWVAQVLADTEQPTLELDVQVNSVKVALVAVDDVPISEIDSSSLKLKLDSEKHFWSLQLGSIKATEWLSTGSGEHIVKFGDDDTGPDLRVVQTLTQGYEPQESVSIDDYISLSPNIKILPSIHTLPLLNVDPLQPSTTTALYLKRPILTIRPTFVQALSSIILDKSIPGPYTWNARTTPFLLDPDAHSEVTVDRISDQFSDETQVEETFASSYHSHGKRLLASYHSLTTALSALYRLLHYRPSLSRQTTHRVPMETFNDELEFAQHIAESPASKIVSPLSHDCLAYFTSTTKYKVHVTGITLQILWHSRSYEMVTSVTIAAESLMLRVHDGRTCMNKFLPVSKRASLEVDYLNVANISARDISASLKVSLIYPIAARLLLDQHQPCESVDDTHADIFTRWRSLNVPVLAASARSAYYPFWTPISHIKFKCTPIKVSVGLNDAKILLGVMHQLCEVSQSARTSAPSPLRDPALDLEALINSTTSSVIPFDSPVGRYLLPPQPVGLTRKQPQLSPGFNQTIERIRPSMAFISSVKVGEVQLQVTNSGSLVTFPFNSSMRDGSRASDNESISAKASDSSRTKRDLHQLKKRLETPSKKMSLLEKPGLPLYLEKSPDSVDLDPSTSVRMPRIENQGALVSVYIKISDHLSVDASYPSGDELRCGIAFLQEARVTLSAAVALGSRADPLLRVRDMSIHGRVKGPTFRHDIQLKAASIDLNVNTSEIAKTYKAISKPLGIEPPEKNKSFASMEPNSVTIENWSGCDIIVYRPNRRPVTQKGQTALPVCDDRAEAEALPDVMEHPARRRSLSISGGGWKEDVSEEALIIPEAGNLTFALWNDIEYKIELWTKGSVHSANGLVATGVIHGAFLESHSHAHISLRIQRPDTARSVESVTLLNTGEPGHWTLAPLVLLANMLPYKVHLMTVRSRELTGDPHIESEIRSKVSSNGTGSSLGMAPPVHIVEAFRLKELERDAECALGVDRVDDVGCHMSLLTPTEKVKLASTPLPMRFQWPQDQEIGVSTCHYFVKEPRLHLSNINMIVRTTVFPVVVYDDIKGPGGDLTLGRSILAQLKIIPTVSVHSLIPVPIWVKVDDERAETLSTPLIYSHMSIKDSISIGVGLDSSEVGSPVNVYNGGGVTSLFRIWDRPLPPLASLVIGKVTDTPLYLIKDGQILFQCIAHAFIDPTPSATSLIKIILRSPIFLTQIAGTPHNIQVQQHGTIIRAQNHKLSLLEGDQITFSNDDLMPTQISSLDESVLPSERLTPMEKLFCFVSSSRGHVKSGESVTFSVKEFEDQAVFKSITLRTSDGNQFSVLVSTDHNAKAMNTSSSSTYGPVWKIAAPMDEAAYSETDVKITERPSESDTRSTYVQIHPKHSSQARETVPYRYVRDFNAVYKVMSSRLATESIRIVPKYWVVNQSSISFTVVYQQRPFTIMPNSLLPLLLPNDRMVLQTDPQDPILEVMLSPDAVETVALNKLQTGVPLSLSFFKENRYQVFLKLLASRAVKSSLTTLCFQEPSPAEMHYICNNTRLYGIAVRQKPLQAVPASPKLTLFCTAKLATEEGGGSDSYSNRQLLFVNPGGVEPYLPACLMSSSAAQQDADPSLSNWDVLEVWNAVSATRLDVIRIPNPGLHGDESQNHVYAVLKDQYLMSLLNITERMDPKLDLQTRSPSAMLPLASTVRWSKSATLMHQTPGSFGGSDTIASNSPAYVIDETGETITIKMSTGRFMPLVNRPSSIIINKYQQSLLISQGHLSTTRNELYRILLTDKQIQLLAGNDAFARTSIGRRIVAQRCFTVRSWNSSSKDIQQWRMLRPFHRGLNVSLQLQSIRLVGSAYDMDKTCGMLAGARSIDAHIRLTQIVEPLTLNDHLRLFGIIGQRIRETEIRRVIRASMISHALKWAMVNGTIDQQMRLDIKRISLQKPEIAVFTREMSALAVLAVKESSKACPTCIPAYPDHASSVSSVVGGDDQQQQQQQHNFARFSLVWDRNRKILYSNELYINVSSDLKLNLHLPVGLLLQVKQMVMEPIMNDYAAFRARQELREVTHLLAFPLISPQINVHRIYISPIRLELSANAIGLPMAMSKLKRLLLSSLILSNVQVTTPTISARSVTSWKRVDRIVVCRSVLRNLFIDTMINLGRLLNPFSSSHQQVSEAASTSFLQTLRLIWYTLMGDVSRMEQHLALNNG